jgi:hypothetical protein
LKNSIKKILIAHSSNDHYGASKVLINTIDIFIDNGFDIYLMLPYNGPLNNNQIVKKANLKIINFGVFRKKHFTFFGLINRIYFIIKSSLYIKKFLKNNQIDLVYTNTSTIISPSIATTSIISGAGGGGGGGGVLSCSVIGISSSSSSSTFRAIYP